MVVFKPTNRSNDLIASRSDLADSGVMHHPIQEDVCRDDSDHNDGTVGPAGTGGVSPFFPQAG